MILGVGIDLVEVARIQSALERFGDRFWRRILCPAEIEYCREFVQPAPYVAARFAAKEAMAKAFGTGLGQEVGWLDLEVGRHPNGAPFALLHPAAQRLLAQCGGRQCCLSLSHTAVYATAVAILEGEPNPGRRFL